VDQLKVADEVWIALARLHQEHPKRRGFRSGEILSQAQKLHPGVPCRQGVQTHISSHCVANRKPSPNTLRYCYRNADGTYRLYREGDDYDIGRRKGRTAPTVDSLPEKYRPLIAWYWSEHNRPGAREAAIEESEARIEDLRVADEVWLALALLHRENPSRESFAAPEIAHRVQQLHPGVPSRAGVSPHIHSHCVANIEPTAGRYRMLYRTADGTLRLYRDGDDYHPARKDSKTVPQRAALPGRYRGLLDWYFGEYNRPGQEKADHLMDLVGLGADVWKRLGGGDAFIRWLRSETTTTPMENSAAALSRARKHGT
jgi:hypothetical protein